MARTPEGARLTAQYRTAELAARAAAIRELLQLWKGFDVADMVTSFNRFSLAAAVLIRARRGESAGLASAYYKAFRSAEGVTGPVSPRLADMPAIEVIRDDLRATGLLGALNARRSGKSPEASAKSGFVRVSGKGTNLVLSGGRDTITNTLRSDPRSRGWVLVPDDDPCDYCERLAESARGSDVPMDFAAHDHCSCTSEPRFS